MPGTRHLLLPLLFLLPPAPAAAAGPVYKSVDARGQVTYSGTPPADAVQSTGIPVATDPDPSAGQHARPPATSLSSEAARLREARTTRQQRHRDQVEAATAALREAEAGLEQARLQREDDWQYLQQGRRVLREQYFSRVEAAEQAVSQARDTLGKLRRDAP
jgi:hypothetical protein